MQRVKAFFRITLRDLWVDYSYLIKSHRCGALIEPQKDYNTHELFEGRTEKRTHMT